MHSHSENGLEIVVPRQQDPSHSFMGSSRSRPHVHRVIDVQKEKNRYGTTAYGPLAERRSGQPHRQAPVLFFYGSPWLAEQRGANRGARRPHPSQSPACRDRTDERFDPNFSHSILANPALHTLPCACMP